MINMRYLSDYPPLTPLPALRLHITYADPLDCPCIAGKEDILLFRPTLFDT